ncbi:type II toxin-antitoxin system Phd/YefM family antitoxin [Rhabdothermincola salaria]|uniref:type II toxin-antitoxin system Phd/YefM family antitoxin n=1 Tax=Rhabdothermincola salaria TaxID=2903142 RepID=UPI001E61A1B8|nr:type II toxin-antitoxin system prevent-host-death family antitoxin [Rhabdothermincola salaria]
MQIGVRELRANLAGLVRRAQAGEAIVVTVSGRPAAVLGPVGGGHEVGLDDLVAMGAVRAPRARTGRPDVARTPLPVDTRSDIELRKVR